MSELRGGLDALDHAQDALRAFEMHFASIEALCAECSSLVDSNDSIRRLGAVHSNLRQTLHSAEAIATLPRQAADAEKLLTGSADSAAGLLRAYLALAELEATVVKVKHAVDAFRAANPYAYLQIPSLDLYFTQVHRAMAKVEDRLWSTVRAYRVVASRHPALLVAALQVIEVQETVDRELLAAGQGGSKLRKGWRSRCMQQLAASFQESFASVLQRCSKLLAEDAAVEDLLHAVLNDAKLLVNELYAVKERVVPCFPPHYAVLRAVCSECQTQVGSMLDLLGLCASRLSNGDILLCLRWVEEYQSTMKKLKQPPNSSSSNTTNNTTTNSATYQGLSLLLEMYISRVASTLEIWIQNIVENDFKEEPAVSQEGKLWTPGPVDLFRILDEQLGVAAASGGVLVRRVVAEVDATLQSFQQATLLKLNGGSNGGGSSSSGVHPLEVLCAVANNSLRCRDLGIEFVKRVRDALAAPSAVVGGGGGGGGDASSSSNNTAASTTTLTSPFEKESHFKETCAAFLEVGNAALASCVDDVYSDPGFAELFGRVGCTDAWLSGTVTGSVLATLDDFMSDFQTWLKPEMYRRLADKLLSETSAHFLAAVIMQMRSVREEELKALRRDVAKINSFFNGLVPVDRAAVETQPLVDIIDFLSSDSVEAFVLSYTTLLETAPGISPVLLSNLLNARVASDEDMTKADAKEVMEACRNAFAGRKHQVMVGGGGGGGAVVRSVQSGGRDAAAFLAALNAARRRPDHNNNMNMNSSSKS